MSDNQRHDDPARTPASVEGHRAVTRAIAGAGRFATTTSPLVHAYSTYAWTDDATIGTVTAVCGTTVGLVAPGGDAVTPRAQVTQREVTCGRCLGTAGDVTVTSPRLEILVDRDPDGGTDVSIFLDGERVRSYTEEVVDPGWGHQRSEWDLHTEDVRTKEGYSEAFRAAVLEAREAASGSSYIVDDD